MAIDKITALDIEQFQQSQVQQCGKLIDELLQQFNCLLVAKPIVTEAGTLGAVVSLVYAK